MKIRPLLVLLLFVVSAFILVWIYYEGASREPRPSKKSLWRETVRDLDACCRRKHLKSTRYDHFASVAEEERKHAAARLFRAIALADRVYEQNCAEAIVRLGGTYNPPSPKTLFHGTTDDNLRRSIADEGRLLRELDGADIGRAMTQGNRYAARMLIRASAGDRRHAAFMVRALEHPADTTSRYAVCPTCGNLYRTASCDAYCPICLTECGKFIRIE